RSSSSVLAGSSRVASIPGPASHSGSERGCKSEGAGNDSETETAQAERLVAEALDQLHWRATYLDLHQKCHRSEIRTARQLGPQTPMSYQLIADRLHMGTRAYVANLLTQSK